MSRAERTDNEDIISFRYAPLSAKAIRLLHLPDQSVDQPWSLNAFDFETCPAYTALSYTWGPPLETEASKAKYLGAKRPLILRTGDHIGRLDIELNLYEGLEQLIAAQYTGHVWVDAICINQDDTAERSSQIAFMGEIYARSEKVTVWLGKDQSNLEDFSWFHEIYLPALEKHFDEGGDSSHLIELARKANLGKDETPRWHGYVLFYEQHRWFHRCWILQEVALPSEVTVFCGSANLNFQDICDLSWSLHNLASSILKVNWKPEEVHSEMFVGHKTHEIQEQRIICQKAQLASEDEISPSTGARSPLQWCFTFFLLALSSLRGYQASNPRDKVYAALGMPTKFLPQGEDIIMRPDYSLSTAQVYQQATSVLIQKLPFLAILSHVEDRSLRKLPGLPSWVPDFSTNSVTTTYASRYEEYPYSACCSEQAATYPRSIIASTLKLYGGYFDAVTVVVEPMSNPRADARPPWTNPTAGLFPNCHRLLNFLSCLDLQYAHGHSRLEALSRTAILNQIDRRPPPSNVSRLFKDWVRNTLALSTWVSRVLKEAHAPLQACMESLLHLDEVQMGTLPNEDDISILDKRKYTREVIMINRKPSNLEPEDETSSSDEGYFYGDKILNHGSRYERGLDKGLFFRQRLYKTSRGYIGLGPLSIRPGDHVCFICDATVPFVLRPGAEDQHYSMVGETYLHGFMNGEVWNTDFKDRIGPLYLI